jgi:hypothetical protein
MDENEEDGTVETYEPPQLTPVGNVDVLTRGSYSRDTSDDSDAGKYYHADG